MAQSPEKTVLVHNYVYAIVGIWVFPFLIAAWLIARKQAPLATEAFKTHYEMQLKTSGIALVLGAALTAISVYAIFKFAPRRFDTVLGPDVMWMMIGKSAQFGLLALGLWVVLRAGRGLYLAGQEIPLARSKSLWPWPWAQGQV